MTKQDIFEHINRNQAFFLATMDGNQPRVRGMHLFRADEDGIIFHTSAIKDVCRQIIANPRVELCSYDFQANVQVRVTGTLEKVEDQALKNEIVAHPSRGYLKDIIAYIGEEKFNATFTVFRLKNGSAVTWTLETNMAPKVPVVL